MKKLLLFLCLIFAFSTTVFADSNNTIQPKSSYVFSTVTSSISKTAYEGSCALTAVGSGHVTIYLQKKNSSGDWENVEGCTSVKYFSDTKVCAHSKSKTLSAGTYRCKTYVIATVSAYRESKTVYSPTLTVN